MDLNNLKDHIKDIELDFDQNEVWQNIQKKQGKGKRKLFYWLSSLLGVLILIFGFFYLIDWNNQNEVRSAATNNSIVSNANISNNQSIDENGNTTIYSQDEKLEIQNDIIGESNNSQEKNKETSDNSLAKIVANVNDLVVAKSDFDRSNLLSNSNNQMDSSFDEENTPLKSSVSLSKFQIQKSIVEKVIASTIVVESPLQSNAVQTSNELFSANVNSSNKNKAIIQERKKLDVFKLKSTIALVPIVYEFNLDNSHQKFVEINNHVEPLKVINDKFFTIKTIIEYGMLNRNISIGAGAVPSFVLEGREKTESALDHIVTGVHVSMPISNMLYFNSGVEYHRMSDKLQYDASAVRALTQDDIPAGVIATHGIVISNSSNIYYNHLNLINIPLEVGAKWSQSKFSEFVSVGMSINLRTRGRQLYINEFQELTDNVINIKNRFNNSYVFKAGLTYDLSSSLEWSFYGSYRFLPDVSNGSSDFNQSYRSYMIGTGFGYKF